MQLRARARRATDRRSQRTTPHIRNRWNGTEWKQAAQGLPAGESKWVWVSWLCATRLKHASAKRFVRKQELIRLRTYAPFAHGTRANGLVRSSRTDTQLLRRTGPHQSGTLSHSPMQVLWHVLLQDPKSCLQSLRLVRVLKGTERRDADWLVHRDRGRRRGRCGSHGCLRAACETQKNQWAL